MSLVIAIDCDDVLTDTLPKVVHDYNERYGTKVQLSHMYRPFNEVLGPFETTTEQEAIQRLHSIYKREGYYEALEPIEGAIETVRELAKKHELHVVTGRQSFLESATKHTLDTYFPGMFKTVEHTNYYKDDTETTAVHRSKAEVCLEIGADILIDDHVTHGQDVLAAGVKEVILFGDYPWNKTNELAPGMVRCATWSNVIGEVEKIDVGRR